MDHVVWDSEWEQHFALLLEETPAVLAYVKNHSLGFEVPYTLLGHERKYRPDYIVKLGLGEPEPLHLVVEIKGLWARTCTPRTTPCSRTGCRR